jgi:hypothetical protein
MYIINPSVVENQYKCNGIIAKYLMYDCNLPLLSKNKGVFYFADTELLKECLEKLPFWMKITKNLL